MAGSRESFLCTEVILVAICFWRVNSAGPPSFWGPAENNFSGKCSPGEEGGIRFPKNKRFKKIFFTPFLDKKGLKIRFSECFRLPFFAIFLNI
jgi:hypothetical protein